MDEGQIMKRARGTFDVVITPGTATGPSRVGAYRRLGAIATLALVSAKSAARHLYT